MMRNPFNVAIGLVVGVVFSQAAIAADIVTGGASRAFQTMGMMKVLDADGNHMVTQAEFDAYHTQVFNALDRNQDGRLDQTEWTGTQSAHMATLGTGGYVREPSHLAMMDIADANHDHIVTQTEFLNFQNTIFVALDRKAIKPIDAQAFVARLVGH